MKQGSTSRRVVYLVCMARRNISLPDDLDQRARNAGLNVSALTRQAILNELDRRERMAWLDGWLDELDEQHGPPSAKAMATARRWAAGGVPVTPGDAAGQPRKQGATKRGSSTKHKAAS